MKTLEYGQWIIEVDEEKTKEYYDNYIAEDTQAHRNFAMYCENLDDEEKAFFEAFGIDPLCCKIEHIGVSKKGKFPCGGKYHFFGKYIKKPRTGVVSVGSVFQREFEFIEPGSSVYAGIFKFDFLADAIELSEVSDIVPEGGQCIEFWCEDMKWILDETCEEVMYEEPKPWELTKIIGNKLEEVKMKRQLHSEAVRYFEQVFNELNMEYVSMSKKEADDYKRVWVLSMTPPGSDSSDVRKKCLKNRSYNTYLWHMFSFGFCQAVEGAEANVLFDEITKGACVVYDNWAGAAFKVKDAGKLASKVLMQFDDVTVTSEDFVWTYSKTHEECCGPYFYRRNI